MAESASDGFVGRTLDNRWQIDSLIGKGGMGFVFAGRQLSVERPVAIKLIRSDVAREPRLVSRFFREAKVLSSLQHPNVVTMIDFGQDEETGSLYLVMELLRGRALSEYVEAGDKFTLREVLQICEQVMSALSEAHGGGVVHRDLKPENLFVDRLPGGRVQVKVIDFGIARVDEPQITRLTQTGCLQGTPHFMAPEQIDGQPSSPQTDLYAVGVILYELLSGKQPFAGNTLMAVLMQHLQKEPEPLEQGWYLDDPLEPKVSRLVHDLLEKDPQKRPETAAEVGRRAHRILAELELTRFQTEEFVAEARDAVPRETVKLPPGAMERDAPRPASGAEASPAPAQAAVAAPAPIVDELGKTMDDWAVDGDGAHDDVEERSGPGGARLAVLAAAVVLGLALIGLVGYLLTRDDATGPAVTAGADAGAGAPDAGETEIVATDRADAGGAPSAEEPGQDAGLAGAPAADVGESVDGGHGGTQGPASPRRRRTDKELEKLLQEMRQP